jgi:hypothetical protein
MSETTTTASPAAAAAVPVAIPAATSSDPSLVASVLTDEAVAPATATTDPAVKTDPAAPVDPKAVEVKPTEFTDFTLPDGLKADDPALAGFKEEASKLGLSQEQAQALVSKVGMHFAGLAEANTAAWLQVNADWQSQLKADKEFGGANFEPMKISVSKLFDDYVGHVNSPERKDLNQALLLTGAGNNPAIVRAWARIAAAHGEGGHVAGNPARNAASTADLLYPTHNQAPGASR